MSVHVSSAVWRMRGITSTEKLILLYLADKADDSGENAYPAVATIATECCVDERTVQRTLARLLERGAVSVQQEHDRSAHRPTTYRITQDWGGNLSPQRGGTVSSGRVTSDPIRGGTVSPDPIGDPSYNHQERSPEPLTIEQERTARHLRRRIMDEIYGARTGTIPPQFGEKEIRRGASRDDIDEAIRATLERPAGALYGSRGASFALGCIKNTIEDREAGRHADTRGSRGSDPKAPGQADRRGVRTVNPRRDAAAGGGSLYDYDRPIPTAKPWPEAGDRTHPGGDDRASG